MTLISDIATHDTEHERKSLIIPEKKYYAPETSENPRVMWKHVDVRVAVWEKLTKLKAEMHFKNFSELIEYLINQHQDYISNFDVGFHEE
jgi:macrodomain Ter protein organizer (MatP/YcbG family)